MFEKGAIYGQWPARIPSQRKRESRRIRRAAIPLECDQGSMHVPWSHHGERRVDKCEKHDPKQTLNGPKAGDWKMQSRIVDGRALRVTNLATRESLQDVAAITTPATRRSGLCQETELPGFCKDCYCLCFHQELFGILDSATAEACSLTPSVFSLCSCLHRGVGAASATSASHVSGYC